MGRRNDPAGREQVRKQGGHESRRGQHSQIGARNPEARQCARRSVVKRIGRMRVERVEMRGGGEGVNWCVLESAGV